MALAAALAAKKAKMGIKDHDPTAFARPEEPVLNHPFFGHLKRESSSCSSCSSGSENLSPRSRRLSAMQDSDKENQSKNKENPNKAPKPILTIKPSTAPTTPAVAPPPPVQVVQPAAQPLASTAEQPSSAKPAAPIVAVDLMAAWSEKSVEDLSYAASCGSKKNLSDSVGLIKTWSVDDATRQEMAASEKVFCVLGAAAMGGHNTPREGAIQLLNDLCEDARINSLLMSNPGVFGALEKMMASSDTTVQIAGVQLFATLCEKDTYSGGMTARDNKRQSMAGVYFGRESIGGQFSLPMGDDALEDPEEILAKVIARAQAKYDNGGISPAATPRGSLKPPLPPFGLVRQKSSAIPDIPEDCEVQEPVEMWEVIPMVERKATSSQPLVNPAPETAQAPPVVHSRLPSAPVQPLPGPPPSHSQVPDPDFVTPNCGACAKGCCIM